MTNMLSKLDQAGVFDTDGNEEVAKLLSALEEDGFRTRVATSVGKFARIYIYGKIRLAADADRGSKNP